MQSTVRLLVILFLIALVVQNYLTNRVQDFTMKSLDTQFREHAQLTTRQVEAELRKSLPNIEKGKPLSEYLQTVTESFRLEGIALIDSNGNIVHEYPTADPSLSEPSIWATVSGDQKITRWESFIVARGNLEQASYSSFSLLFDAAKLKQIEHSSRMIGYLNLFIIGCAALLGLYLLQSTIRPLRVLMQTARSAGDEAKVEGTRNDADFIIGTFRGVIAKLKEKEAELGRLHLAEKARADEIQQLNQDLLRSIKSGLILIDSTHKIQVFNEAAATILQVSRIAVLRQPFRSALKDISHTLVEDIDHCFDDQAGIQREELEVRTRLGNKRYLSAQIMPLRDRQQAFSGVFCIFADITEFKMLQQHMAQKEKFVSLGEMAAGVAHEFRNSLATIAGYVQMVEQRTTPQQESYVAPIQKELKSLQKVVNDFLSFSRPVPLEIEEFSLSELIRDCVEEVRISRPNSEIDFSINGEFPTTFGDEVQLHQVFLNLIRNAAEALDGKSGKREIRISGSVSPGNQYAVIDFYDNGNGIPPEDLSRVFTPFFSTKKDGVGLGLAIVQKLILQHNGTITVDSTEKGTVFEVQIPLEARLVSETPEA